MYKRQAAAAARAADAAVQLAQQQRAASEAARSDARRTAHIKLAKEIATKTALAADGPTSTAVFLKILATLQNDAEFMAAPAAERHAILLFLRPSKMEELGNEAGVYAMPEAVDQPFGGALRPAAIFALARALAVTQASPATVELPKAQNVSSSEIKTYAMQLCQMAAATSAQYDALGQTVLGVFSPNVKWPAHLHARGQRSNCASIVEFWKLVVELSESGTSVQLNHGRRYISGAAARHAAAPGAFHLPARLLAGENEIETDALIDTGSEISLISGDVARKLGWHGDGDDTTLGGAASGTEFTARGSVEVTAKFDGTDIASTALVVENLVFPFVLGAPEMRRNHVVLDVGSRSLSTLKAGGSGHVAAAPQPARGGADATWLLSAGESIDLEVRAPAARANVVTSTDRRRVDTALARTDFARAAAALGGRHSADELRAALRATLEAIDAAGLLRASTDERGRPLGTIKGAQYTIKLKQGADVGRVKAAPRRRAALYADALQQKINELVDNGVLEPLATDAPPSAVLSTAFVVPKPSKTGEPQRWRLVVDLRPLNREIVIEQFPTKHARDLLEQAANRPLRSRVDLADFYHQISLAEGCRWLTDVLANGRRYRYTRLMMGLAPASAVGQHVTARLFDGPHCVSFFDDVLHTHTADSVLADLTSLRDIIIKNNVAINGDKCDFLAVSTTFLGHQVGPGSIGALPQRFDRLREWPAPNSRRALLRFLGAFNYVAAFVPNFRQQAAPLFALTSTSKKFVWSAAAATAFDTVKELLIHHCTLTTVVDGVPIRLYTDASSSGTSFVFAQIVDGKEKLLEVGGYSLKQHQKKYSAVELELLAIVHAIRHRPEWALRDQPLEWFTDNQTAANIITNKKPLDLQSVAMQNATIQIMGMNIKPTLIKGNANQLADAVSRVPIVAVGAIINDNSNIDGSASGNDDVGHGGGDNNDGGDGNTTPSLNAPTPAPTPARATNKQHRLAQPPTPSAATASTTAAQQTATSMAPATAAAATTPPTTPTSTDATAAVATNAASSATSDAVTQRESAAAAVGSPLPLSFVRTPDKAKTMVAKDWWNDQRADGELAPFFAAACHDVTSVAPTHVARLRPCVDAATGVLYVREPSNPDRLLLVVPRARVRQVLRLAHDSSDGGHGGAQTTAAVLRGAVWWSSMAHDITEYCKSCPLCQAHRPVPVDATIGESAPDARRFGAVYIDWQPMPTAQGLGGFFLIRDATTGWIRAMAFDRRTGANTCSALASWIADYGVPDIVHADAGSENDNLSVAAMAKLEGFRVGLSAIGGQQSNGIVESPVKVVKKLLSIYARAGTDGANDGSQWPTALVRAQRAYNRRASTSRGGKSPFELVYGEAPWTRLLADAPIAHEPILVPGDAAATEAYTKSLGGTLAAAASDANEQRHRRHETNERHRIRLVRPKEFAIGQLVMLDNTGLAGIKFLDRLRQTGPYKIVHIDGLRRQAVLENCYGGATHGPVSFHRLALAPERITEKRTASEADGVVAWSGIDDPKLLRPNEQAANDVAFARQVRAAADEATKSARKQLHDRLDAQRADRDAEAKLLGARRKAVVVEPNAQPIGRVFTTTDKIVYRVDGKKTDTGQSEPVWVFPEHPAYRRLAERFNASFHDTLKRTNTNNKRFTTSPAAQPSSEPGSAAPARRRQRSPSTTRAAL